MKAEAARSRHRLFQRALKRLFDIVLAAVLLVLLAPVAAAVALAILLDDGAPVLFRQTRIGHGGRPFTILKFRSMRIGTPNRATNGFHDAQSYITATGRLLRKTSLDELPQLVNILLGQMSFVGPRPLIPAEEEVHRLRHEFGAYRMRPGITGLAQVNGRDLVGDREKARWDAEYVSGYSLGLDARILWRTVAVVAKAEGVRDGHAVGLGDRGLV